jgi:pimeloyl-ACP methyl ester carboxylesterase
MVSRTAVSGPNGIPTEVRPGRWVYLHVHPGGERDATTVFLSHGLGGNCRQWREQWRALAEAGYRIVAWDLPGHGNSPTPRRKQVYAGKELVLDTIELLQTRGGEHNVLVGHSYGARLNLAVLQHLRPAGRLALVDRVVLLGVPDVAAKLSSALFRYLPLFMLEWLRPLLDAGFRKLAWHPEADPELIGQEQRIASGNALHAIAAVVNQAAVLDPASLSELHLPVLVLSGDSDRLTPLAGAVDLVRRLPAGELQILEACGHQLMLEKPAETNRHLLRFLEIAGPRAA